MSCGLQCFLPCYNLVTLFKTKTLQGRKREVGKPCGARCPCIFLTYSLAAHMLIIILNVVHLTALDCRLTLLEWTLGLSVGFIMIKYKHPADVHNASLLLLFLFVLHFLSHRFSIMLTLRKRKWEGGAESPMKRHTVHSFMRSGSGSNSKDP